MRSSALLLGALTGTLMFSGAAYSKDYTVEVTPDHRKCYKVQYVPQTVLVNTKGKLIQGKRKTFEGDFYADGSTVIKRKRPAVYIERRTVLEEDHYSLRPVGC